MTKELTPLEALENIKYNLSEDVTSDLPKSLKVIEKILKEENKYKEWFDLMKIKYEREKDKRIAFEVEKEKQEKVLKIIREKRVDCNTFMFYLQQHNETEHIDYAFDSYNDYAKDSEKPLLTKTEFDALKEILL